MDTPNPPRKRIAVIPGDGIGQEVIPQALNVIRASGANVEFTEFDWGADRYLRDGTTVPPDGFAMLARDFDAILAGAFAARVASCARNVDGIGLRRPIGLRRVTFRFLGPSTR